jgi:hypothetical protein
MRERLSNAQYRFLRQMERQPAEDGKDEKRLPDVEPLVLARWLASPPFKRRLGNTLIALRQRRELAMMFAAARAAERLSHAMEKGAPTDRTAIRACLELVKLVRMREHKPLAEPPTDRQLREKRLQERITQELYSSRTSAARRREITAVLESFKKQGQT